MGLAPEMGHPAHALAAPAHLHRSPKSGRARVVPPRLVAQGFGLGSPWVCVPRNKSAEGATYTSLGRRPRKKAASVGRFRSAEGRRGALERGTTELPSSLAPPNLR